MPEPNGEPKMQIPEIGKEDEEKIIDGILKRKKKIDNFEHHQIVHPELRCPTNKYDWDKKRYLLSYGSKILIVSIYDSPNGKTADTYVKNTKELKKPQETTLLYKAAKKLIQNEADKTKKDIEYFFYTKYESMSQWATNEGKKIFNWENIKEDPIQNIVVSGETTFRPKKKLL